MAQEIEIDGISYITSKRAAEISGYAQDYIGQLCRAGLIQAQRVGGLWYLHLDSLYQYKQKADSYVPVAPRKLAISETESLVSFDGKDYISAARAAEITGYHQDYVGQLAREGKILSRQVGNRWYVERSGILAHKKEKDALLAKVQTEAVGIQREENRAHTVLDSSPSNEPFFTYSSDDSNLLPILNEQADDVRVISASRDNPSRSSEGTRIAIHTMHTPHKMEPILDHKPTVKHVKSRTLRMPGKSISYAIPAVFALTIVIVLSVGYVSLGSRAIYSQSPTLSNTSSVLAAKASEALLQLGDLLERMIVKEHTYRRVHP